MATSRLAVDGTAELHQTTICIHSTSWRTESLGVTFAITRAILLYTHSTQPRARLYSWRVPLCWVEDLAWRDAFGYAGRNNRQRNGPCAQTAAEGSSTVDSGKVSFQIIPRNRTGECNLTSCQEGSSRGLSTARAVSLIT